jgi:hypothetical protein
MADENVEVQGGLPVTVSKTGTMSPASKIALDPTQTAEILKNMQAMINERTSPLNQLQRGLERASAWAVPNTDGQKTQALNTVNTQQAAQDQTLFNMRTQMAAYKAAQAQAEAFKRRAAEQMGGGMPMAGGRINAEAQMPPQIRQALQNALSQNDQAGYDKIYNAWAQKQAEVYANPNMDEPKIPVVELVNGQFVRKVVSARDYRENQGRYRDTPETQAAVQSVAPAPAAQPAAQPAAGQQPVSVRNNNPGNLVDPKTGQIRTFATPAEGQAALDQDVGLKLSGQSPIVKERFGPQVGTFMSPALLAETWAPATAPGNSPESTANYAKVIADRLGIDPTAAIPNTPEAKKAVMEAITQFEAGTPKPVTTSPAPAPAAPTAGPGPRPTPESLEKESAVQQAGSIEAAKATGTEIGKLAAEVVRAGQTAPDRELRSKDIVDLTTDPELQKYIGMFIKKGTAPFVIRQIESGVNAGQFGVVGIADLKKNLTQAKAPPEVIAKLDRLEKNLNATQLEYAQTYLKGQGAVSDAERRLIASVVGSYVNNAPKFIELQGRVMQERAQFDAKVNNAWQAYKDKNGTYSDFDVFLRTAAKPLVEQHKKDLGQILGRDTSSITNPFQVGAEPKAASSSSSGTSDISSFHIKKK